MKHQNKSIEGQMKWLKETYPYVFGQKISMIVKSALLAVDTEARGEERERIEKGVKKLRLRYSNDLGYTEDGLILKLETLDDIDDLSTTLK